MMLKDKGFELDIINQLRKIEDKTGHKIICAGLCGTRLYDVITPESDFDFKVLMESGEISFFQFDGFDFVCAGLDLIDKMSIDYKKHYSNYPTVLYRRENTKVVKSDMLRDDFLLSFIFEIVSSRFIWGANYIEKNYESLLSKMNTLLILDYYYSRAYGNLKNVLIKEEVLVKKCLLTVSHVLLMKDIVISNHIGDLCFLKQIKKITDNEIKSYLEQLYYEYTKNLKKTTGHNPRINNWIVQELEYINNEMKILGKTESRKIHFRKEDQFEIVW